MKTLLIDIETAPHLAAVWGLWQQNVGISQIIKPGYTMCWSAKWHGEKEVFFDSILSGHNRMIRRIYKLINEADVVAHYNGRKFDIPILNKEFLLLGLAPPAPYKQVDLLTTARGQFKLASNKLDFVAQSLGLGKKIHHKGFELWLECMAKDPLAWQTMEKYNKQDVILLEKVYDRLLPWIKTHPNAAVYLGNEMCCPRCASVKIQRRGIHVSTTRRYARYQCKGCGGWFTATLAEFGSAPTKAIAA